VPGADRTPTPLRAFCIPFEDLFTLLPRKAKQKGRIARGSVAPVWSWVSQSLLPDETKAYSAKFRALIIANKHTEAREHAASFWPVAGAAIQHALATDAGAKAARGILGAQLIVDDAVEMALLLSIGHEVLEIQRILPKPVPSLTDELLWALRAVYDRLTSATPDAAPHVAVISMHRLAKPWEALKLPLMVSRQTQDTLISSTDMGLVGEIIFGDIEAYGKFVREARQPVFDADALMENLSAFNSLSNGIVKGIDMRRDGKWGQRLMKDRAQLADVMDSYMERAPKELAGALPMQKGGTFTGGPKVPDFSRPIEPEKTERGLRYAKLVAGCKALAASASFGASQKKAEEDICQMLRSYNEDVVKELRTAEGPRRPVVESQFDVVCALTSILFSEEEAEFLRRRGRAAQAAAA
jgi:hypothetical protein